MSFSRIKPSGWSLNEKLTSAQQTQLDIDHANALDKSIAGDILEGTIQLNNANAILQLTNDGTFRVDGAGIFSLNSGSINSVNNCNFSFNTGAQLNFHSSSDCTFDSGCTLNTNGQVNLNSTVVFNGAVTGALASTWTLSGAVTATNLTIAGTANVKLASRSITRVCNNPGITSYTGTQPFFNCTNGTYNQVSIASSPEIFFELDLPHNASLTSVSAAYTPASGHGSLPGFQPGIYLTRIHAITGSSTTLGSISPIAGSVVAYEVATNLIIDLSGSPVDIDRTTYRYILRFLSEGGGGGAIIGLALRGAKTVCTITEYDEG